MEYEKLSKKKLYYVKDNTEYLFIPILNPSNDHVLNIEESFNIEDLPNIIHGKYFNNYIGYNPIGWWVYVEVNKNELLYK